MEVLFIIISIAILVTLAFWVIWGMIKLSPYVLGVIIVVIGSPVIIYKSLKLAFTKGSTLYKWRALVVFDIIAIPAIIILVAID